MRLIVNADDLGYSRGVNCGIADAHRYGVVTSATVMVNMPAFEHAMVLARTLPTLGVGLHFNITKGRPLGKKLSTLTKPDGTFKGADFIFSSYCQIDPLDIEQELCAQMQALIESGCRPTHIDSHHHVHAAPVVRDMVADYAQKMRLPVRSISGKQQPNEALRPDSVVLCVDFHGDNAQAEWLISFLENCRDDVVELMTHPGFVDEPLLNNSAYGLPRATEHAVLTSAAVNAFVEKRRIRLIRYDQL